VVGYSNTAAKEASHAGSYSWSIVGRSLLDGCRADHLGWHFVTPIIRQGIGAARHCISAFLSEVRHPALADVRSICRRVGSVRVELRGEYYFTSEKGLFRIDQTGVFQVMTQPCYGVAFKDDWIFLSVYQGGARPYTAVVRGRRDALGQAEAEFSFQEVYRASAPSSNTRIHGIFAGDEALWAANTGRNTLLRFDFGSTELTAEIPLVDDPFGLPVLTDQNHLNGVSEYDGVVLFTAYRAGRQSMVGVFDGTRIVGYGYPNAGIHDIYLTEDDLFLCDTFGANPISAGGALFTSASGYDGQAFDRPPGFVVRGLAGGYDEMLIGHSHKGPRRKRFKGSGAILISRQGAVQDVIPVEPSQIYQIIAESGAFVSPRPVELNARRACAILERTFGPPIYEAKAHPL